MRMKNWIAQLDRLIQTFDGKLLDNAGSISHKQAMRTAETEYQKYQSGAISSVEQAYLETLKKTENILKNGRKITASDPESGKSS